MAQCVEREGESPLLKKETDHLCVRQPIRGIKGGPFQLRRVGPWNAP